MCLLSKLTVHEYDVQASWLTVVPFSLLLGKRLAYKKLQMSLVHLQEDNTRVPPVSMCRPSI